MTQAMQKELRQICLRLQDSEPQIIAQALCGNNSPPPDTNSTLFTEEVLDYIDSYRRAEEPESQAA